MIPSGFDSVAATLYRGPTAPLLEEHDVMTRILLPHRAFTRGRPTGIARLAVR